MGKEKKRRLQPQLDSSNLFERKLLPKLIWPCYEYGLDNVKINVDSIIGSNQIPVVIHVNGTSMLPTLQDGQKVLINKTHNIHIGDIVVANSSEYGGIIKRVGDIKGNSVFLQSDNKKISYEYINGKLYKISGISTWVDISDINGVVIDY